ncbi:hypothetical protein HPB50_008204 [Hyalomma asiaticum]|uniref:Uncharacterized protein n=1 Tax=Hyalomma asiaticum TaxID=266040 RepID=A0ACB7SHL7_HYAAI|nr:hypothetical protein HPB50_008204 [Hyalomma asiaticum]
MVEEDAIPLAFSDTSWSSDLSKCTIQTDCVWNYLHSTTSTVSQAHRGWALKEEDYVRNLKVNLETSMGLVRTTCTPSMKSGMYVVSAWFLKYTGTVVGAYCECVTGLSETCQHVAAMLLAIAEQAADKTTCTDIPCRCIVPPEAKKPPPRLPLKEIAFQRHSINKPARSKVRRDFEPSRKEPPSGDVSQLREKLSACCPTLQALRYLGSGGSKSRLNADGGDTASPQ